METTLLSGQYPTRLEIVLYCNQRIRYFESGCEARKGLKSQLTIASNRDRCESILERAKQRLDDL